MIYTHHHPVMDLFQQNCSTAFYFDSGKGVNFLREGLLWRESSSVGYIL